MSMILDGSNGLTTPGVVNTAGETIATTLSVTGVTTLTGGLNAALPVLSGGTGVTTKTGTGNVVLSASPTITGTGSILASSIGGNVTQSNIVTSGGPVGSVTAGTFTDTGASLSLVAGTYLISTTGVILISTQSGTGVAFRFCQLALTDNSNTVINTAYDGASTAFGTYQIVLSFVLTVSSTTTYKTRFSTQNNSGTPTISYLELYTTSTNNHSIIATRLT